MPEPVPWLILPAIGWCSASTCVRRLLAWCCPWLFTSPCGPMYGNSLSFNQYFIVLNWLQEQLCHAYLLQLALHAHLVVMALLAIVLTAAGLRSQYLCLISMVFYGGALLINLLSTLHDRGKWCLGRQSLVLWSICLVSDFHWSLIVTVLQVLPFCYFCYAFYTFLVIFFPIMGRNGASTNPDLIIALTCGCCTLFALGFAVSFLFKITHFEWVFVPKDLLFRHNL